ncbi:Sorbosone dehydrogenase-domain-containing protein [Hyaloraphidium curvatum]|nr:Sorbosone dehydrogenase-domain-containing protein [Hyaloraphidium curvatum]
MAYPSQFPPGFSVSDVVGNLGLVTDFAFLDGSRILVANKMGQILLVKGNYVAATLLDIGWKLGSVGGDRGLTGVTVHPQWPASPYIYVGYVRDDNPPDFTGRKYNVLSRYTLNAEEYLDPYSERVLLGACNAGKVMDWYGDDCMPQDGTTHTIDWLGFGKDGNLWVSVGDGETFEGESWDEWRGRDFVGPMDPRFLGGKILRLNPDTGEGLPDNPFWNGNSWSAASRVWAVGLRNPFRCGWVPGTDNDLMCGEVGWFTMESIKRIQRGANLGWPCWEGNTYPGMMNADFPGCRNFYSGATSFPGFWDANVPFSYPHNGASAAAIGGVFMGDKYPAPYRNSFIFADFPSSKISALEWDTSKQLAAGWDDRGNNPITPRTIAINADQPVSFKIGPDGFVWYIGHCVSCSNLGIMRRITFDPAQASAAPSDDKTLQDQGLLGPIADRPDLTQNSTAPPPAPPATPESCRQSGAVVIPDLPQTWDSQMFVGSFINSRYARNGDGGPVELDASVGGTQPNDGTQLTIGGVRFGHGIGTRQISEIHVGVNSNCFRFRAQVGIDDQDAASGARAEFIVKLDGRVFWNSTLWNYGRPLRAGDPPLAVDIKGIQGVSDIGLYGFHPWDVDPSTPGSAVDWADARIFCGPDSPYMPTVTIANPIPRNSFRVNDTVAFSGSAMDFNRNAIPPENLHWYINLLHCQGALCHTHFYQNFAGITNGTFQIADHTLAAADQFIYFEVRLVAKDECERTNQVSRYVVVQL